MEVLAPRDGDTKVLVYEVYRDEGSLEYEVEGRPTVTLKPGDVLFIPAGTIHAAKAVGSAKGVELATYIVEKGKPLLALVN
jgi:quercetin dioxygenase-like cupin family protein